MVTELLDEVCNNDIAQTLTENELKMKIYQVNVDIEQDFLNTGSLDTLPKAALQHKLYIFCIERGALKNRLYKKLYPKSETNLIEF